MKFIATAVLAAAVVGGVAVAAPTIAQAEKPELCKDISVPVKVRLAEGCFLPDSGPALPPGGATFTPPPGAALAPVPFNLPALVPVPPGAPREPAAEGD